MRLNLLVIKMAFTILTFVAFNIIFSRCSSKIMTERASIKIVYTSLPASFINESNKLTDEAQLILSGIESDANKCNHAFILDPTLIRSDLKIDTSIVTKIEKSPIAASTAVRDFKVVREHLKEIVIPTKLLKKIESKEKSDSLSLKYISENIQLDSVLVFSEKTQLDSIDLNGKKYKVLAKLSDVRSKIINILCQNPKASITLLINPPVITIVDKPILGYSGIKPTKQIAKKATIIRHVIKNGTSGFTGDLTIIKGTEGCDICTRYYSATDNVGRIHEVKEKNSTNCCPCGKTIEMKGRTYRMECSESGNRLALVE